MPQPNQNDFVVGFDPTNSTTITGAQLAQLVNSATPNNDRGLVLVSSDSAGQPNVPNATSNTGTPAWQRYLWLRISPTYVTAYVWNPGGATDPTYLNWVTLTAAAFAPNSIPGYALIGNSVPATAIISLAYSQITGAPALAMLNVGLTTLATDGIVTSNLFTNVNFIWGDLKGGGTSPGSPVIKPLAITQAKMALQSVAGGAAGVGQIVDNSVTSVQLLNNGGNPSTIGLAGAVDPAYNIALPTQSVVGLPSGVNYTPTSNTLAGDVLAVNYQTGKVGFTLNRRGILTLVEPTVQTYTQVPIVAIGGTAYSLGQIQGSNSGNPFGRILQRIEYISNAIQTSSGLQCPANTRPTQSNVTLCASLTSALFKPLLATSTIIVDVCLNVYTASNFSSVGALFQDSTANAVAAAMMFGNSSQANPVPIVFKFSLASSSGLVASGTTFKVGFAPTTNAAACYLNSVDGSNMLFGGTLGVNSWVTITEYI